MTCPISGCECEEHGCEAQRDDLEAALREIIANYSCSTGCADIARQALRDAGLMPPYVSPED